MTFDEVNENIGTIAKSGSKAFIEKFKEAKENADYVIAVVHWGTEHTTVLEEVQRSTARDFIDAGADIIIGGHSHCLQGIEYYEDKPIFYSLGNFWFDEYNVDTMLVNIRISGDDDTDGKVDVSVVPAVQETLAAQITQAIAVIPVSLTLASMTPARMSLAKMILARMILEKMIPARMTLEKMILEMAETPEKITPVTQTNQMISQKKQRS